MTKKERQEMEKKVVSVEETVKVLKLQESNLLEVIVRHPINHPKQHQWIGEVILGCDYIIRLEHSIKTMKELLGTRRKHGGKKKD